MIDLLLIGLVLLAMAALGVVDARRMIVDPLLVLALVGAGLLWRLCGSAETGSLLGAALGAVLGIAVAAAPIAIAQWCRRPWPLFPGDAMLLGGLGFVLGPLGLGWSLLAGSLCSLLHRAWLQRRRGRAFRRGYCPLGPGMVAGAMAVFVFVNAGGSLAAEPLPPEAPRPQLRDEAAPLPAPPRPGPRNAAAATDMLAATELGPVRVPLPGGLSALEIDLDEATPLPLADLTGRIAGIAGVPVEVEERPARVAGGAAVLADVPDTRLAFEGRLPGLLNLVAARTGYDWSWRDGAIVLYRYWDVEQRPPQAAGEPSSGAGRETAEWTGGPAGLRPEGLRPEGLRPAGLRPEGPWSVDKARHPTLRDVLEDWAGRAGWTVVWNSARRYAVGAGASFEGGFLDAVDALLAAPATRRSLVAFAHESNRHLVIEDRGTAWSRGSPRSRGSFWSGGSPWNSGAA